tara:strand:- start:602 stop:1114 length:513 start_codon:yes stop_codon:yes gene_type:complete
MSKNKLIILIFVFFLFSIKFSLAKDQVAFMDVDYIIKNSIIGKSTLEKINNLDQDNVKKLKQKNNELKKQEVELKNKENIISAEAFQKELKILKNKINIYKNEKNLMVQNLSKLKKEELDKVFKKIGPIVSKYMEENSIVMVFDTKNMFMGNAESDITEEILNELNKSLN